MNFSEQPQQHPHTEAVFCALATSPGAHCLHMPEAKRHHLDGGSKSGR